jgi:hypothetical protein
MRKREKNYWWLVNTETDQNSGYLYHSYVSEPKDFAEVRACVWRWYRSRAGNKNLSVSAKLILWSLCERWRWETCSSHDAIDYYAKMVGLNRKTCGRAIAELIDKNIIWLVLEDKPGVRLRKSQPSGRKHFLLVGLGTLIRG